MTNRFGKAVLVLMIAILPVSAAWAAPSALISEQKADSEYTKLIPGGIEVTYRGLWKHGNVLEASYTITSKEGRRLSIEAANSVLRDSNDVEITLRLPTKPPSRELGDERGSVYYAGRKDKVLVSELLGSVGAGAYIYKDEIEKDKDGKEKIKDTEEIVADQPYQVTVRYWVDAPYVLTPTFKLVTVVVNGLPVEFKDVTVTP